MPEDRLTSGISGLDEILSGGFISGRTYLVVGGPGTGKTIFSLQWLLEGVRRGESVLLISLAEPTAEMTRSVASLQWDLSHVEMVDLGPSGSETGVTGEEYHVFVPGEVEQTPIWESLYRIIDEKRPNRVVIDSATQLRYLSSDEYQFRKHILNFVTFLDRLNCTSILTFEPSELEREMSVSLAVDGIIRLHFDTSPRRVIGLRGLRVEKLRGSDFYSGVHSLRITSDGMVVFPHRIVNETVENAPHSMLSFGIRNLDDLVGGGIESGTTTLLSGPTGTGKSTVSVQLLSVAAQQSIPVVMFTFEEQVESIVRRSRGIGMPIDDLLQSGMLHIVNLNPLDLYPDEFLNMVREIVMRDKCQLVLIDSLRSYGSTMEEFGSPVAHIRNLVNFLKSRAITTVLVQETSIVSGTFTLSEDRVSHICDNVLFLRYAEESGHLIKIIGCLKKRMSDFRPEVRELRITSEGIQVNEALVQLAGSLFGAVTISE